MVEVTTGVFVGDLSATVRDLLWKKCETKLEQGRCALIYRMNNEQGFTLRLSGDFNRSITELDGLQFIAVQNARWQDWRDEEKRKWEPPEHMKPDKPQRPPPEAPPEQSKRKTKQPAPKPSTET